MLKKDTLFTALTVLAVSAAAASPAFAKGGGGGGGGGTGGGGSGGGTTTAVASTPSIAPGTFEGIGTGPVYIYDSFGHGQNSRYKQDGTIINVVQKPNIDGIRAEYPNNKTETWIGAGGTGPTWNLTTVGPGDPLEPHTPLQESEFGYQDGDAGMDHYEFFGPQVRPNALVPFAAPTDSAYTVQGNTAGFNGKTAIGFTSSGATTSNFETNGQAWLELDYTGNFEPGPLTNIVKWTFHTNGTSGDTLSGTYNGSNSGWAQMAVSYDPVNHVASATLDGNVVASVPYTAQTIKYAGVEGLWVGNINNFAVRAGTVTDPMPDSLAPPAN
jgi:hypothetical protein